MEIDLQIMIIDDQSSMRSILKRLLSQEGLKRVTEASNGEEALEMLANPQHPKPDVILCDLYMDKMDGMEFAHQLRRNKTLTPVLMLTGEKDNFIRDVAAQAGATKVLSKPIASPDLRKEIFDAVGFVDSA